MLSSRATIRSSGLSSFLTIEKDSLSGNTKNGTMKHVGCYEYW